jgi:hypothetical protein
MKILAAVDFNTDTIRIGNGYREAIIDIETDHGSCVESQCITVERKDGIIIKKTEDGRIVLGVQDEDGN